MQLSNTLLTPEALELSLLFASVKELFEVCEQFSPAQQVAFIDRVVSGWHLNLDSKSQRIDEINRLETVIRQQKLHLQALEQLASHMIKKDFTWPDDTCIFFVRILLDYTNGLCSMTKSGLIKKWFTRSLKTKFAHMNAEESVVFNFKMFAIRLDVRVWRDKTVNPEEANAGTNQAFRTFLQDQYLVETTEDFFDYRKPYTENSGELIIQRVQEFQAHLQKFNLIHKAHLCRR